ncbi:MAG: hypothetical protein KDC43_25090, partial [Saprospiraceae bacterium]|nr:hypothetical protein [Saprospiraceae bacterium]
MPALVPESPRQQQQGAVAGLNRFAKMRATRIIGQDLILKYLTRILTLSQKINLDSIKFQIFY